MQNDKMVLKIVCYLVFCGLPLKSLSSLKSLPQVEFFLFVSVLFLSRKKKIGEKGRKKEVNEMATVYKKSNPIQLAWSRSPQKMLVTL